ncbi:MAG: hypothetical protein QOE33_1050 [Acidobacteriota bacterium]|nr:hypothetical protein [Acidobacteriota bacterium]
MDTTKGTDELKLVYTIMCDDVRLEAGNKLSLMGVFQNIGVEQLPVSLIKFAIVSHWQGGGTYMSEVRVLTPDRKQFVVASQPAAFEIEPGGYADNVSFFVNVVFHEPGRYWVQTLIDSTLFAEQPLVVNDARQSHVADESSDSETIN